MALTTSSVNPSEPKGTEAKRDTEAKREKTADTTVETPVLQSSDPAIQQLLAERQGAVMNRDALQPTSPAALKQLNADIKAADERIAEIDKKIADFGKPAKDDDEDDDDK